MDGERAPRPSIRGLFKGQGERAYIFGKLERLAHAVVLILSQTGSDHPVVERLQTSVLDSIREAAAGASELEQSFLISIVLEMISLLRIAATANIISANNADILVAEYTTLLEKLAQPSVQGMLLRTEDLLEKDETVFANEQLLPSPIDSLFSREGNRTEPVDKRYQSLKRQITKGHRPVRLQKDSNKGTYSSSQSSDRAGRILDIVTAKGTVSIRDVASVITDCSEKTLQRELLSMVENGVLKKEGERRWSTYRLA